MYAKEKVGEHNLGFLGPNKLHWEILSFGESLTSGVLVSGHVSGKRIEESMFKNFHHFYIEAEGSLRHS